MFGTPRTPDVPEYSVGEVATALAKDAQAYALIDVREPEEWNAGHIAGATLIPLGQLGARAHEVPTDRPVVLVCRSGRRSAFATDALRRAGYDQTFNMTGGMLAWEAAGLPVSR